MATYPSILAWKFQGQRNLVGYSSWSQKVSDMTEQLTHTHTRAHTHTHSTDQQSYLIFKLFLMETERDRGILS